LQKSGQTQRGANASPPDQRSKLITMSTNIDYAQVAAKLDYTALDKKLEQLAQHEPPKKHKTAADVLEPLRERLLALQRKGWSSVQLVGELKAAGIPVSPACLRECLSRWTAGGNGGGKSRPRRRQGRALTHQEGNGASPATTNQVARSKSATGEGQTGLKLTGH
jgi:hypothetical protein